MYDSDDYSNYSEDMEDYYNSPRRRHRCFLSHSGPRYNNYVYHPYAVALDCEMVEDCMGRDMVARVSIVDMNLQTIYDTFVAPTAPVRDYRTRYSGVRPRDLIFGENFNTARATVRRLLLGALLVGHGVPTS